MPMAAALGLGIALVFGVLSMLLPLVLKLLTIPLMLAGLLLAGFAFFMGDELQWFDVMRLGRFVENNRVTSEISEEEK